MNNDYLHKQQSSHHEGKYPTVSSSSSFNSNLFNRDVQGRRDRLYTFKDIPTTDPDYENVEMRDPPQGYKTPERKTSPAFLTSYQNFDNVSNMEMEENNGFMQSVTVIPKPTGDSSKSIGQLRAAEGLFSHFKNSREHEWDTPKLPSAKKSFGSALQYIESRNNRPIMKSAFDQRSVS